MPNVKTRRLTFRLTDDHDRILEKLERKLGLEKSDCMRFCINFTNFALSDEKIGLVLAPAIVQATDKTFKESRRKRPTKS